MSTQGGPESPDSSRERNRGMGLWMLTGATLCIAYCLITLEDVQRKDPAYLAGYLAGGAAIGMVFGALIAKAFWFFRDRRKAKPKGTE